MAVNPAVLDNLNHISHFHTSLSQFSQTFPANDSFWGFIVLAGLYYIQSLFWFLIRKRWENSRF